jgi:hypothetical protein
MSPTVPQFASFKNDKDLKKTDGSKRQRLDGESQVPACLLEELIRPAQVCMLAWLM